MTTATLEKTRDYERSGWSLSELLPDPSETGVEKILDEIETDVQAIETMRDKLDPEMEPAILLDIVKQFEEITAKAFAPLAYGGLWFSSDTQSTEALTFQNRLQQVMTDLQNRILFFSLWWKDLDDDEVAALMPPDVEEFADYRHYLDDLRRTRPFTLDERTEQVINTKDDNGISALITIYSMLTNRLTFNMEEDGETKELTRDELMSYAHSADETERAAAYEELYRVYAEESKILGQIYTDRVRDWTNENVEMRSFSSPLSVRNVSNDIPDAAVDALLDVCRQNVGLFQRYFKLKAGWLGVEKLRRYDIYAPLAESDHTIEFDEGVKMVLETFESFDPNVARKARRVFTDNHVDSEIRPGKRGGAFSATVLPSQTPWVLLNYTNKVRDVATLAHELGHAIHSMMAEDHSVLTQHPTLPLAETASVFAEILLTDRLLASEQDPIVRRELLAAAVDDMYATVMRQAYFVIFEHDAHAAIMENRSVDELNALYMENLREQFGDSLELPDCFQHEWVSIPHIYHTPFYCYAYSFGQLLVLSLYRRFQEEGDAFKPGYLKLLAYGGSARPEVILTEAGIDVTDPAFWQGGFNVISDMIDELEAIK